MDLLKFYTLDFLWLIALYNILFCENFVFTFTHGCFVKIKMETSDKSRVA